MSQLHVLKGAHLFRTLHDGNPRLAPEDQVGYDDPKKLFNDGLQRLLMQEVAKSHCKR